MKAFKELINKEIKKLFLIVWPPLGEVSEMDIDISFGFVFCDAEQLCVITTDKTDMWTPCVHFEDIPSTAYQWGDYSSRIRDWMESRGIGDLDVEYYDVTNEGLFKDIVASKIRSVEMIFVAGQGGIWSKSRI